VADDLSIALVPLANRRMTGVKTVFSGAVNRTVPQDEIPATCRNYQQEAAQHPAAQGTDLPLRQGDRVRMMNNEDMPRRLNNSDITCDAPVRAAFQNGLVYGIVFCDWFVPGFLARWKSQGKLEEDLVGLARSEAALIQKRRCILPFALENPVGGSPAATSIQ